MQEEGFSKDERGMWESFCIEDLLQRNILDHVPAISAASALATKELLLDSVSTYVCER
jgi:hypothetical protein